MNSADAGQNQVMTWAQARRFLDARFVEVRERALVNMASDPCACAVFLRVHRRKWAAAIKKLAQARLPQKNRTHKYRRTRTVNATVARRPKIRPLKSKVYLEEHPRKPRPARKGKRKLKRPNRSHKKGEYDPITTRGRPKKSDAEKKKTAERRNRRRRKKRTAERIAQGKPITKHPRKKTTVNLDRGKAAWKARHLDEKADRRSNHDRRYGYLAPMNRERRTAKQVSKGAKPYQRHEGAGNSNAVLVLAIRAARMNLSRARKLRAYWAFVRRNSK